MKRLTIVASVCITLGIISGVLSVVAEAKKIKASQVTRVSEKVCYYPRSPSYALGIASAAALVIAHVLLIVATACLCCRKNRTASPPCPTFLAVVLIILSWSTLSMAFVQLLSGADMNDGHGSEKAMYDGDYCSEVAHQAGHFYWAAASSLLSVLFGVGFFLILAKAATQNNVQSNAPIDQDGIPAGQPRTPPIIFQL